MKNKYEKAYTVLKLVAVIVLIWLGIKTILEPRTVQIIIGEDDVIDAIMCDSNGACG